MGAWGTSLFSDDVACDIRDHYRQLLEDGVEDASATRLTVEKFRGYFDEPGGVAWLSLAVTQSRVGRLDPDLRDRALAVLHQGGDLEAWERDNPKLVASRRAVLEKARAQLTGPQPVRRRLRPPKRISSGLAAGDVLSFALPDRLALLRVVRVRSHRLGETPVLEELDFTGTDVPARDVLDRLAAKVEDPIVFMHALSPDTRLFAFVMKRVDWQAAGFRKVETTSARDGDDQAAMPGAGISWAELAARYRRRGAKATSD